MPDHALQQVIAIPRNGYINRLQAWASASILGKALGVPTRLLWEFEPAAPASADELFGSEFLNAIRISREEVDALLGCDHEDLPRYLTALPERHAVVLAGHDRGEQVFMSQLQDALAKDSTVRSLVIIAGGQFHEQNIHAFDQLRREFYQSVQWNTALESRVRAALDGRGAFLAVHVRQTDRSLTAPTTRSMRHALSRLQGQTQLTSVFIAADTPDARDAWQGIVRDLGLKPWSLNEQGHDRSSTKGGVDAMVDWRILSAAQGLVYSADSSFGHEAATMIGKNKPTIGLRASSGQQRARNLLRLAHSAVTYPRRHLWR
ncbi:MAG: hypothetical protein Q7L55_12815 [Actinomycetota bacterium]|nr:hypothetical protein [Actinomycetota bacterium]